MWLAPASALKVASCAAEGRYSQLSAGQFIGVCSTLLTTKANPASPAGAAWTSKAASIGQEPPLDPEELLPDELPPEELPPEEPAPDEPPPEELPPLEAPPVPPLDDAPGPDDPPDDPPEEVDPLASGEGCPSVITVPPPQASNAMTLANAAPTRARRTVLMPLAMAMMPLSRPLASLPPDCRMP
jgi:hypothetical protein